jgi:hypothetical protein
MPVPVFSDAKSPYLYGNISRCLKGNNKEYLDEIFSYNSSVGKIRDFFRTARLDYRRQNEYLQNLQEVARGLSNEASQYFLSLCVAIIKEAIKPHKRGIGQISGPDDATFEMNHEDDGQVGPHEGEEFSRASKKRRELSAKEGSGAASAKGTLAHVPPAALLSPADHTVVYYSPAGGDAPVVAPLVFDSLSEPVTGPAGPADIDPRTPVEELNLRYKLIMRTKKGEGWQKCMGDFAKAKTNIDGLRWLFAGYNTYVEDPSNTISKNQLRICILRLILSIYTPLSKDIGVFVSEGYSVEQIKLILPELGYSEILAAGARSRPGTDMNLAPQVFEGMWRIIKQIGFGYIEEVSPGDPYFQGYLHVLSSQLSKCCDPHTLDSAMQNGTVHNLIDISKIGLDAIRGVLALANDRIPLDPMDNSRNILESYKKQLSKFGRELVIIQYVCMTLIEQQSLGGQKLDAVKALRCFIKLVECLEKLSYGGSKNFYETNILVHFNVLLPYLRQLKDNSPAINLNLQNIANVIERYIIRYQASPEKLTLCKPFFEIYTLLYKKGYFPSANFDKLQGIFDALKLYDVAQVASIRRKIAKGKSPKKRVTFVDLGSETETETDTDTDTDTGFAVDTRTSEVPASAPALADSAHYITPAMLSGDSADPRKPFGGPLYLCGLFPTLPNEFHKTFGVTFDSDSAHAAAIGPAGSDASAAQVRMAKLFKDIDELGTLSDDEKEGYAFEM